MNCETNRLAFAKQLHYQFVTGQLEMCGDIGKDRGKGANSEGFVLWNGNVVFSALQRGEAHVAAGLSGDVVA